MLKRHCENEGRDYDTIERTVIDSVHLAPDHQSPDDVVQHFQALADHGIQHVLFNMPNVHEVTPIETFAKEVLPRIAEM